MEKYTLLTILLLIEAAGLFQVVAATLTNHRVSLVRGISMDDIENNHAKNRGERHRKNSPAGNKTLNKTEKTEINVRNVTAQTGTTAILECEVGLKDGTVLWTKKDDKSDMILLTVNETTHTRDKRFRAEKSKTEKNSKQKWSLHIRYTENSDGGIYECQISSDENEKHSIYVRLILKEAFAEIFGGDKKVVKPGSPLRLSCILRHLIQSPTYIFWYHHERMINYDLGNGAAIRHGRQGSELIFPRAEVHHSGNYSCVPSNARQASVWVHVGHPDDFPPSTLLQGGVNIAPFHIYNLWNIIVLTLFCFCR